MDELYARYQPHFHFHVFDRADDHPDQDGFFQETLMFQKRYDAFRGIGRRMPTLAQYIF